MIAMGLSGFFNDLSMPGAWGACMDVGGKAAGSLSGSMNMMGNLGGALGPVVTPYLLSITHNNWTVPIWVAAATYLISALCWCFIDSTTPIEAERPGGVTRSKMWWRRLRAATTGMVRRVLPLQRFKVTSSRRSGRAAEATEMPDFSRSVSTPRVGPSSRGESPGAVVRK